MHVGINDRRRPDGQRVRLTIDVYALRKLVNFITHTATVTIQHRESHAPATNKHGESRTHLLQSNTVSRTHLLQSNMVTGTHLLQSNMVTGTHLLQSNMVTGTHLLQSNTVSRTHLLPVPLRWPPGRSCPPACSAHGSHSPCLA